MEDLVQAEIRRRLDELGALQCPDGAWRFCFESGPMTDAYMILLLRVLGMDGDPLLPRLARRILSLQGNDGVWRLYPDSPPGGNLSATIESCYALRAADAWRENDSLMDAAKRFILEQGGLQKAGMITKVVLALTGQYPWPRYSLPAAFVLFPRFFPLHFFDFVGYGRAHIGPVLLAAGHRLSLASSGLPSLADLAGPANELVHTAKAANNARPTSVQPTLCDGVQARAYKWIETYLSNRMEPNGTLCSYASATFLLTFTLLAAGCPHNHPRILSAVDGLKSLVYDWGESAHVQNSPSTVWDTALLSHALQSAGLPARHPTLARATSYLLTRQHERGGDWQLRNRRTAPGGWGFSDVNTMNPDVDDTTAALQALAPQRLSPATDTARKWERGIGWLLSMQNRDGGWPAFERNTDKAILQKIPIDGARAVLTDPSTPDLTGRVLSLLGGVCGLTDRHPRVSRGITWLLRHQRPDGSWRGKWGICFLYGTWAVVTGLRAVGVPASHPAIRKATGWLLRVQRPDGGWGESCRSDVEDRYVPLYTGTIVQTAWAVDALLAASDGPLPAISRGIRFILTHAREHGAASTYPTGGGLPGGFYIHYHSYRHVWPLLALANYHCKHHQWMEA